MKKEVLLGLGLLILVVLTVNWAIDQREARNPYTIENVRLSIEKDVPIGSKRPKVIQWLQANQFVVDSTYFDAARKNRALSRLKAGIASPKHFLHTLYGYKEGTRAFFPCGFSLAVSFAFDENDTLRRFKVEEPAVCL